MRRFLVILASCLVFYLVIFYSFHLLTNVAELRESYPHVIYDKASKTEQIEIKKQKPAGWVSLGSVSPIAVAAIVLSEDWAFYQHNGFDWEQIRDSFQKNLAKGTYARGGSTISQQVVKNVYLSSEKTIWRKVQEAILTMRMERQLKKKRILEIYLNVVEFGEGLYGIGPAAQFYFKKPASALTAKEGAFLAMLLPSPKKYSVSFRKRELTRYARGTIRSIMSKLLATHRLSYDSYLESMNTPLSFERVVETVIPEREQTFDGAPPLIEELDEEEVEDVDPAAPTL